MNRTKDIIIDAFWQLLAEKPYNKITVKDIVDRCQINRNTFYYHFHDIPELLEDTVKRDTSIFKSIRNNHSFCCNTIYRVCYSRLVTAFRRQSIVHPFFQMHLARYLS